MGKLTFEDRIVEYQWASDVEFDGIRMEVLSDDGRTLFDLSVPDDGPITINTFGKEIAASLIEAAIEVARRPR
ncbi:hypothetical protein [Bradyrhizobium sp. BR 10289]|uniref:hypothetical protein n=1 Tax=Bradyrhizobium sp. BR 10289 TaxID=2749993 RepID=UPI001C64722B|nr:hypothetical protein [Bradyrhizobium sp. BR 10289]MBW7972451.1 hypothetical protein [Bradyrhizobium sp. BR 10289]